MKQARSILEDQFESSLKFELDANGNAKISHRTYTPTDILNLSDKYEDEYEDWLKKYAKSKIKRYREIQKVVGTNLTRLDNLSKAITSNKVVPFIGAGMSVPSGLKTWVGFLHLLKSISTVANFEIDQLIDSQNYEEAAFKLFDSLTKAQIDEKMELFKVEKGFKPQGGIAYVPLLFKNCIITTNYDNLLEASFSIMNEHIDRVILGRDADEIASRLQKGERILFKMHGDYDTEKSRVFTSLEYDVAYGTDEYINAIKMLYLGNTLLFMGCSLISDRYLDLISQWCTKEKLAQRHYALLKIKDHDDSKITQTWIVQQETRLAQYNIFPIWFTDYETDMTAILFGLMNEQGILNEYI